jgi:hypothetical protein
MPGTEALNCESFEAHEFRTLEAVDKYMGRKFHRNLVEWTSVYHVIVYPAGTSLESGARDVFGFNTCGGSISLRQPDDASLAAKWHETAMAHEYIHSAQKCDAYSPKPDFSKGDYEKDYDHANWITSGAEYAQRAADDGEVLPIARYVFQPDGTSVLDTSSWIKYPVTLPPID